MSKLISFPYGIRDKELESHNEKELTRIRESTKEDADIFVYQNLLDPSNVFAHIVKEIGKLKKYVSKILQPEIDRLRQEILIANIPAQQIVVGEQVKEINRKITTLEVDLLRDKSAYDWSKHNSILVSIYLLSLIDLIANYAIFQSIGIILLLAITISILIALAISVCICAIGTEVKSANNVKTKWSWILVSLIGAGLLYYILGIFRQTFKGGSAVLANSPLIWMLLNLAFFSIALLIASQKLPSKEEKQKHKDSEDRKKRKVALMSDRERLLLDLKKEEELIGGCIQRHQALDTYRNEQLMYLDSELESIQALFIKECELRRGNTPIYKTTYKTNSNGTIYTNM